MDEMMAALAGLAALEACRIRHLELVAGELTGMRDRAWRLWAALGWVPVLGDRLLDNLVACELALGDVLNRI